MRRFRLIRHEDPTGISGTGCVAQGVLFGDGPAVVRWLGDTRTTTLHENIESVETIHCHEGKTTIKWQDPICWQCAATLEHFEFTALHCYGCGAGQGPRACFKTRPSDLEWFVCRSHEKVETQDRSCVVGPPNDCMFDGPYMSKWEAERCLPLWNRHA